jgi:hypothetical protein
MKHTLIILFAFITSLHASSQSLGETILSIYNSKQIFDRQLNKEVTTKDLFRYSCNEKEGYNRKIDANIIIGLKMRICNDSWIPFFYLYLIDQKELHLLTSITFNDDNNPNLFDEAVTNISEIYIFNSSGQLKYNFSIPAVGPQNYRLIRYALINGTMQFEKGISVNEDVLINNPNAYNRYVKNHTQIHNMTLKEYFDIIDSLKLEIDSK